MKGTEWGVKVGGIMAGAMMVTLGGMMGVLVDAAWAIRSFSAAIRRPSGRRRSKGWRRHVRREKAAARAAAR